MNTYYIIKRVVNFLIVIILVLSTGSAALAQNPSLPRSTNEEIPNSMVVGRVYYENLEKLDQLSNYLDIWEVNHDDGYLVAMLSPDQYSWLQQAGYVLMIDQEKTALLGQTPIPLPGQGPDSIPGYPCYRTVEEDYASMVDISINYQDIAELIDIGDSWDKLMDGGPAGYEIYALRLTNETIGDITDKPTFFLMAEIHAREYVTAETAMRYAEYLVNNYGTDPDITWLLDYFRVYIVTMTNPDGRKFAEQGQYWRKNTDNVAGGGCGYPNYGIDLNRNHGFHWGGAGYSPCDETYQGPSPVSEPETTAIQDYVLTLFPDQRGPGDNDPAPDDTTGIFISLHSYSQLVLWPWGWTYGQAPNNSQLQTLGRHLAFFNSYTPQQAVDLYPTTGTSDDWSYGELGIASYTFEMGTSFFQGCTSFENTIYPNNLNALLYAIKTARRPYLIPLGPDTLDVTTNPNSVPGGTPVQLTAVANDTRYNNSNGTEPTQNIIEARYSIDNPSWITDTVTYPLSAADGNFNSKIENIVAEIDTSDLIAGKHTIFVESKDADGNWGITSSAFLTVTTPAYGVMLTPETAQAQDDPGETITYQLQVNNIGLNSDMYDISVESAWPYDAPSVVGPLNPGENATFDVLVTIPIDAIHGEADTAIVSAISQYDADVSDSSSLTSTANYYDLSLLPGTDQADGYPGGQAGYTLQLTNLGNTADSFTIIASGVWTVTAPTSVGPINPGAIADISILVDIPPSAIPGEFDAATIEAASQGNESKTQTSNLTTTAIQAGPSINPENDHKSGNPGNQVIYTLELTNHNYLPDTFTISANAAWNTEYPLTVGPIPADGSSEVQVIVDIPADVDGGAADTAAITFSSSIPGLPDATATLTTSANNVYSFEATPILDTQTAHGRGTSVDYTVVVTNTGNVADTYNIHVISSDWDVDAPQQVGPIARGESAEVTITIWVPLDIAMGDSNDATLAFISQGSLVGHQVHLHTDTFWNSFYLPLSQKH